MQCKLINLVVFAMHSFALQSEKDVSIKISSLSPKDDACLLHVLQDSIKYNS